MNKIEIIRLKTEAKRQYFDFLIDDYPISNMMNIDRFDIAFLGFDLDVLEGNSHDLAKQANAIQVF